MTWHTDTPDEYRNQIVTGDARELAKRIPDESVDLIFTDPPYENIESYKWLSELAARVLKSNRPCLAYFGIGYLPETVNALGTHLTYRWRLVTRMIFSKEFHGKIMVMTQECLWYDKGHSVPYESIFDVHESLPQGNGHYNVGGSNWGKGTKIPMRYLSSLSLVGDIVLDPFSGMSAIAASCKMLGRNYIAFEIDPDTATRARERVANTQTPLTGFVIPTQPRLDLTV